MAKDPAELERFYHSSRLGPASTFFMPRRADSIEPEFEGSDLNLAGWTKKISGLPTITVGSVGLDSDFLRSYGGKDANKVGINPLIRRLERDEFDLVAVGRGPPRRC